MRELFTTLFVCAAIFMVWRTLRPQRQARRLHAATALPLPHETTETSAETPYKWPTLGLFHFPVSNCDRYQGALRSIFDGTASGAPVTAMLHTDTTNPDIWKPIEVKVHGLRVGFLSSGDATRLHRRLTFEGRAGQTTCCDAVVVQNADSGQFEVRLDLKEFRH